MSLFANQGVFGKRENHITHVCGFYHPFHDRPGRQFLAPLFINAHTTIVASTSRTTLTQTFQSPSFSVKELKYAFPLYDGVSVVGFVCTINNDRVIHGVVKERSKARETFNKAVAQGQVAGLLEQSFEASDVFTTTVGNIPANASLQVEITYLGELKHDAQVDGIRFTIPTTIAPRYGNYPGELLKSVEFGLTKGISITVDAEMPNGSQIKSVQSPSHPIAVTVGNTSVGAAKGVEMSLQKASATLTLGTTELDKDFILHVVATNTANPVAVLETHPTIPNHRALMATLVPKFNLPSSKPEIVFVCDRSGSMADGKRIPNLKAALHLFLKSLPLGVKFNICSFGSRWDFMFPEGSRTYDASSLAHATQYVDGISANYGGTEMYKPLEDTFDRRYKDMDLEVFMLTDGEIWDQKQLFELINAHVEKSEGAIRVFSLGIGNDVSHALIEGVAQAGNGFSQSVADDENMNSKVIRMLKASLSPHVKDYTLEIKYGKEDSDSTTEADDDFELVEKVQDTLVIDMTEPGPDTAAAAEAPKKPISLFDDAVDLDTEMTEAGLDTSAGGKYSHVPKVPEPKILQAPFVIPPLFSFSRTSVYLLLSPEASRKTPKSVVLRGTCPSGPLELEVPVTVLTEPGETIHQLAARKAVKEFEEGRGWIYHAKDSKDDNASRLQIKYFGRFSDMVEREAVRLGVTYQVGGKWCSFVAVEKGDEVKVSPEQSDVGLDREAAPVFTQHGWGFGGMQFGQGGALHLQSASRVGSLFGSANQGVSVAAASTFGAAQPMRQLAATGFGVPQPPSNTGGLFGATKSASSTSGLFGSTPAPQQQRKQSLFGFTSSTPGGGLFGAAPPPPAPSGSPFGSGRGGLFGSSSPAPPGPAPCGGLLGSSSSSTSTVAGFFGSASPAPSSGSLFGLGGKSTTPFGAPVSKTAIIKPAVTPYHWTPARSVDRGPTVFVTREMLAQYEEEVAEAACEPLPEDSSDDDELKRLREEFTAAPQQQKESNRAVFAGNAADKLEDIVSLQQFVGQWTGTDDLLILLGLDKQAVAAKVGGSGLMDKGDGVFATVLVLAYLEVHLGGRKDEWEMMADKARDWLEGQGVVDVDGFVEKAKQLL
ncbi:von Willebrand factor type A domain-containing protein [Triangularia setosa]|uniref:von Willebrand factor type A domain-containing protein n=1 Tax=Triangularia setosa TaxID=2587417 RepID=A0AAN6W0W1_9PEZI|nr:von Willebrand factor type A domain-containing protein [Podospora setosa]